MKKKIILNNLSRDDLKKAQARTRHIEFIDYTWQKKDKFIRGLHTGVACKTIDEAFEKYRNGISSFLKILIAFRHGKSDISSRYLPAHFLGEFPDDEVIVVSHSASKAYEFSRFGRKLLNTPEYNKLYPDVKLAFDRQSVDEWEINNYNGKAQYFGIGGGAAGKGGNLLILDDYFANRQQAESKTYRERTWTAFTNDLLTRMAPVAIVLLVVTPWHVDDINGRIEREMKENPNFPDFMTVRFPAFSKKYKTGTLFPERFSKSWYSEQMAALGKYAAQSLMQCDPKLKTGNMLRIDKVKYYDELPDGLRLSRGWDLASSKKERMSDNPDFTVGVRGGVNFIPSTIPGLSIPILYIDDIVKGRWEVTERNKIIINAAIGDGEITQGIEAFGAYKDAFIQLQTILMGIRSVKKVQLPGDKISKASILVPIFEAGNVYINNKIDKDIVNDFLDVVFDFPGGLHDDDVDAITVLFEICQNSGISLYTSNMYNDQEKKTNLKVLKINE